MVAPSLGFTMAQNCGERDANLFVAIGVEIKPLDANGIVFLFRRRIEQGLRAQQCAPKLRAQVRRVNPPEDAVPVGVIALRAQDVRMRLFETLFGCSSHAFGTHRIEPARDAQRFLVQQVHFEILHHERAPDAAAQEPAHIGTRGEFVFKRVKLLARRGRQRPLHHFRIGGRRQIGSPERGMRRQIFAGRRGDEPFRIAFNRGEKLVEPSILVAMFIRAGPPAKLFAVVSHGHHAARMASGSVAQKRDRLIHATERKQVSHGLQPGNHLHLRAAFFGDVIAEELVGIEPCGQKVDVVEEGIVHLRTLEHGGQLRLPDALSKPCARGCLAEALAQIFSHALDLLELVGARNRNQDRFIETAADHLDLSAPRQRLELRKKLRMARLKPFEQRPGIVEAETDRRVPLDLVEKRQDRSAGKRPQTRGRNSPPAGAHGSAERDESSARTGSGSGGHHRGSRIWDTCVTL